MSNDDERFNITTPLGFSVRTSNSYWNALLVKHPYFEDIEPLIQQALSQPDEVRRSSHDPGVILFYCRIKFQRWAVAVTRKLEDDGFLITAYQTSAIKEGETLWPK